MTVIIDCAAISCETSSSFCFVFKENVDSENKEEVGDSENNKVVIKIEENELVKG